MLPAVGVVAMCAERVAAQSLGCAWSLEPDCAPFTMGVFAINVMGAKSCPADALPVKDSATCKEAADLAGLPFSSEIVEEGTDCHFCTGCDPPQFRLNRLHGKKAKFVCIKNHYVASTASSAEWPECQERDFVIRGKGQELFTDLQGFGGTVGCYMDDCLKSDKFVANEIVSCTKVCKTLPDCEYWVWGMESGEQKCWFRTGDFGREAAVGWISGSKSCAPPGTEPLILGNAECWSSGFDYETCCDVNFGPSGNPNCWDGVFSYDRCCFPKEEL